MKVLITGGCGFIGTNLVLERLAKGDRCACSTTARAPAPSATARTSRASNDANLDLVDGDIRDADLDREGAPTRT
jgi:nucleoside-diphosphate-sugar epimerase